eukprot:gene13997-14112_t
MKTSNAKQFCKAAELDAIKSDDVQLQQRILKVMKHRRVVLDVLADISIYDPKGVTNVLAGPGQTQQQQVDHIDQGQQIAERLLALSASAASEGGQVAAFLAQHCTVIVSR